MNNAARCQRRDADETRRSTLARNATPQSSLRPEAWKPRRATQSIPTRRHSCASGPTSVLDPLDRTLGTRQRQFRLRLFLQHFRGALPGHCGPLAEMLDSVTAKMVRLAPDPLQIRLLRTVFGDRLRRKQGDGLQVTIGYEPHFAKTARISRESPTEGWRRGRWGSFGRCIAGTGFAHGGGMVTGTWILPRSLMMPESARRGREERHRTYHAVCR